MAELLRLPGVRSDSLLGYLKGLGLLQILGRQDDGATKACWQDGALALLTDRTLDDIAGFFAERWAPAPVVSPWNGGSGFWSKKASLDWIRAARDPRLARMQAALNMADKLIADLELDAAPNAGPAKVSFLHRLRAVLPDDAIEWLDAVVVLSAAAFDPSPVLGSGGNDGNFDLADNYTQVIASAFGRDAAAPVASLRAALTGETGSLRKMSLAHLFRDASPVNAPSGQSDALGNPWDLVLAVHGVLLFTAGATRRLGGGSGFSAPFTLRSTGAGYGSAVAGEKGRAELWMPLWERPATLAEVQALLREGRVQVGRRGAVTGLDAVRAVGVFGVARGISAFERFAVLERAGQSNLSLPAGRVDVRPSPAAAALATLDPWLERVIRHLSGGSAPESQRHPIASLENAVFALAQHGTARKVVPVLQALGRVECALHRADADSRPLGLRPAHPDAAPWVALLDTASVEHRLAVAWASSGDPASTSLVSVPAALLGAMSQKAYGRHATWTAPAMAPVAARLAAIHERRWLTSPDDDARVAFGHRARLDDLARFVRGDVDDRVLSDLIVGLSALAWSGAAPRLAPDPASRLAADPLLSLLALAFWDPRPDGTAIRPRREWVSQLNAGRFTPVVDGAHLRLTISGAPPLVRPRDLQIDSLDGTRLAAALLARPARSELDHLLTTFTTIPQETDL